MNQMAWIAMAAIIVASINSWAQFWLKERSERKKNLATANPATNQPNITKTERDAVPLFFIRNKRLLYWTDWFVNTTLAQVVISIFWGFIPLNFSSGMALFWAVGAAILVNIVTWNIKIKI